MMPPADVSATAPLPSPACPNGKSRSRLLLLALSYLNDIVVRPGLGLLKFLMQCFQHFPFRRLLLPHFRPQSKHDCGEPTLNRPFLVT